MPTLSKKPVLALGATALVVMGVSGFTAQARTGSQAGTTPTGTTPGEHRGHGGPGGGRGAAMSADLAKALGVTEAKLAAAVAAIREDQDKPDPAARSAAEAKVIADALGVETATVQKVLEAQRPARPAAPNAGTTPGATTPDTPAGTTPRKGEGPRGHGGRGHGGPGGPMRGGKFNQTALITALAKATGKSEASVKAALAKAQTAHEAEHQERAAEFAKKLAAELGLNADKVAAAIEANRPERPSGAAKQSSGQTK